METPPPPSPAPPSEPEILERSQRNRRIPRRFQDFLPASGYLAPLQQYAAVRPPPPPAHSPSKESLPSSPESSHTSTPDPPIITEPNEFGLYREYKILPSVDPDDTTTIANLCDAPTFSLPPDGLQHRSPLCVYGAHVADDPAIGSSDSTTSWFAPFINPTICRLMHWFYSTTTKTLNDLNRLVNEVILAPDFAAADLESFDANREAKRLDSDSLPTFAADGWIKDHVKLHLPQTRVRHASEDEAPTLDIQDVWHRSLLDIVRSAFEDASSLRFHLKGFKQMWERPDGQTERVYGEAYTSDAFLEMEDEINPEPGCSLETVVAPMMIYSDSTCLANFGTAALWPAYVGFGLMSKYVRAIPSFFQSHHLAYFPVVRLSSFSYMCRCSKIHLVTGQHSRYLHRNFWITSVEGVAHFSEARTHAEDMDAAP